MAAAKMTAQILRKGFVTTPVGLPQVGLTLSRDVRVAGRESRKGMPYGYVEEDNSGKSNIFGIMPTELYSSSPTVDKIAKKGLGGQQGVILLLVILATVAASLSGELLSGREESLSLVAGDYNGEALSVLSGRVAESLD